MFIPKNIVEKKFQFEKKKLFEINEKSDLKETF